MSKSKTSLILFFFIFSFSNSQEIEEITIGYKTKIKVEPNKNILFNFAISQGRLTEGQFFVFSTRPEDNLKPAFIYISLASEKPPSPDNRDFAAQKIGQNILFINKNETENQEGEKKYLYICINSLEETTVDFEVNFVNNISLDLYQGIRPKLKLTDISNTDLISFTYKKTEYINTKKILFYSLAENINYFNMRVEFSYQKGIRRKTFDVKQRFENGYGAIVNFNLNVFDVQIMINI